LARSPTPTRYFTRWLYLPTQRASYSRFITQAPSAGGRSYLLYLRIKSQMMRSRGINISSKDIKKGASRACYYLKDRNVIRTITTDIACIDIPNEEIDNFWLMGLTFYKLVATGYNSRYFLF
jgi:hypothetical protein